MTTDLAISPLVYEIGNFLLWTIGLLVLPCFWYFMWRLTREHVDAVEGSGVRDWLSAALDLIRYDHAYRAAVAIGVYVTGSIVKDGWSWLARWLANTDRPDDWMIDSPWVYVPIVGIALAIIGKLCMIRVFAPPGWGREAYVTAGLAAITAALLLWFFR